MHPDDEYARHHHDCLGKTEAWYVLDAEPGAEVAVGFRKTLTPDQLKTSALSGEIENLLDWRKVHTGDVILTPAGTVHAIGAGVTICEIQQNSDITYRLYDYGRPRELHLDHGVNVSHLGPYNHGQEKVALSEGREQLAACRYFRIERLRSPGAIAIEGGLPHYLLLVSTRGSGSIAGSAYSRRTNLDGSGSSGRVHDYRGGLGMDPDLRRRRAFRYHCRSLSVGTPGEATPFSCAWEPEYGA